MAEPAGARTPRPKGAKDAKDAKSAKATGRSSGVVYAARRGRCPSRVRDRALGCVCKRAVIPTRAGEVPDPAFDRDAYRERNVVERRINRLEQWRRIAARYEKRSAM